MRISWYFDTENNSVCENGNDGLFGEGTLKTPSLDVYWIWHTKIHKKFLHFVPQRFNTEFECNDIDIDKGK